MGNLADNRGHQSWPATVAVIAVLTFSSAFGQSSDELSQRVKIAASNLNDAVVVDCQLPGKLRRLGGTRTYLTPGRLIRTSAIECRTRGGEYTLGDLASGTLSLQRWLPLAEKGEPEAQYYVARIHANGMDNVPVDYAEAAKWYRLAADNDYQEAKQELGYLYERGLGVEQNSLLALNLQREASGLGQELDYAYKIADAQALINDLTEQLGYANGALRSAQLRLSQAQDQLSVERNRQRAQELDVVRLTAQLQASKQTSDPGLRQQVTELEAALEQAQQSLVQSHRVISDLEQSQLAASSQMQSQLTSNQAMQLELQELLSRAEQAEGAAQLATASLAAQQARLIRAEQEINELQQSYQQQTEQVASERARWLEARTQTDSESSAYLAAQQAELTAKSARIASLEQQLAGLKQQLDAAAKPAALADLQRRVEALQRQYDRDVGALQQDREQLQADHAKTEQQLQQLFAGSQQTLAQRDRELAVRKREIEQLTAESDQLRADIAAMTTARTQQASQASDQVSELQSALLAAQQEAVALRASLDQAQTDKSGLEAKLLSSQLALQQQLSSASVNDEEVELLKAEIDGASSTIRAQNLRIAKLERQLREQDDKLSSLAPTAPTVPEVTRDSSAAMTVLEMARSPADGPSLGRFKALIIANENYQNMAPLTTPVNDAEEIKRLLVLRYGFEVETLVNATDDQIMSKLHEYSNTLTPEDNLLVYYSGRGAVPKGPPDRAYWLGVDADPQYPNTWLLSEHVSDKIAQISAKRVLLVTDSCFSQRRLQANSMTVGRGLDPKRFRLLTQFQSRLVLTSGANQPSSEGRRGRSHSVFAGHFIDILRQNMNVLSGEMLSFEMAQRVRQQTEGAAGAPSYHSLQGAGHRAGDFFFVPKAQPTLIAGDATGQAGLLDAG